PAAGEGRHPLRRRHRAPGAQDHRPQRVRGAQLMPDVNMPKLSDTMEEGTVLEWKKQDGAQVKRGDVLAEIESDKASFEIEAEADGALHIVVEQGKAVPVGQQIATIGEAARGGKAQGKAKAAEPPAEKAAPQERP